MKIVLTGGPCCGKTTLIEELRKKGYAIIPEVARDVLKTGMKEREAIQRAIFDEQLKRELKVSGPCFLDRSIIDAIAYLKVFNIPVPEYMSEKARTHRYDKVLFLEPIKFENDEERKETREEAKKIHDTLLKTYKEYRYEPIVIPLVSAEERLKLVLALK